MDYVIGEKTIFQIPVQDEVLETQFAPLQAAATLQDQTPQTREGEHQTEHLANHHEKRQQELRTMLNTKREVQPVAAAVPQAQQVVAAPPAQSRKERRKAASLKRKAVRAGEKYTPHADELTATIVETKKAIPKKYDPANGPASDPASNQATILVSNEIIKYVTDTPLTPDMFTSQNIVSNLATITHVIECLDKLDEVLQSSSNLLKELAEKDEVQYLEILRQIELAPEYKRAFNCATGCHGVKRDGKVCESAEEVKAHHDALTPTLDTISARRLLGEEQRQRDMVSYVDSQAAARQRSLRRRDSEDRESRRKQTRGEGSQDWIGADIVSEEQFTIVRDMRTAMQAYPQTYSNNRQMVDTLAQDILLDNEAMTELRRQNEAYKATADALRPGVDLVHVNARARIATERASEAEDKLLKLQNTMEIKMRAMTQLLRGDLTLQSMDVLRSYGYAAAGPAENHEQLTLCATSHATRITTAARITNAMPRDMKDYISAAPALYLDGAPQDSWVLRNAGRVVSALAMPLSPRAVYNEAKEQADMWVKSILDLDLDKYITMSEADLAMEAGALDEYASIRELADRTMELRHYELGQYTMRSEVVGSQERNYTSKAELLIAISNLASSVAIKRQLGYGKDTSGCFTDEEASYVQTTDQQVRYVDALQRACMTSIDIWRAKRDAPQDEHQDDLTVNATAHATRAATAARIAAAHPHGAPQLSSYRKHVLMICREEEKVEEYEKEEAIKANEDLLGFATRMESALAMPLPQMAVYDEAKDIVKPQVEELLSEDVNLDRYVTMSEEELALHADELERLANVQTLVIETLKLSHHELGAPYTLRSELVGKREYKYANKAKLLISLSELARSTAIKLQLERGKDTSGCFTADEATDTQTISERLAFVTARQQASKVAVSRCMEERATLESTSEEAQFARARKAQEERSGRDNGRTLPCDFHVSKLYPNAAALLDTSSNDPEVARICSRLVSRDYQLAGWTAEEATASGFVQIARNGTEVPITDIGEPLLRNLASYLSIPAGRTQTEEKLISMIKNLAAGDSLKPGEKSTDEAVAEARDLNMRGLEEFKETMELHYEYMTRKYGTALESISLDELAERFDEIMDDGLQEQNFTNVAYKIPGLFDPENENDQLIKAQARYFAKVLSKMMVALNTCAAGGTTMEEQLGELAQDLATQDDLRASRELIMKQAEEIDLNTTGKIKGDETVGARSIIVG